MMKKLQELCMETAKLLNFLKFCRKTSGETVENLLAFLQKNCRIYGDICSIISRNKYSSTAVYLQIKTAKKLQVKLYKNFR